MGTALSHVGNEGGEMFTRFCLVFGLSSHLRSAAIFCATSLSLGALSMTSGQAAPALTVQHLNFPGLTLAESVSKLQSQFGKPDLFGYNEWASYYSYKLRHEHAWLVAVVQQSKVSAIYVRPEIPEIASTIGDHAGIKIGDPLSRLIRLRGEGNVAPFFDTQIYRLSNHTYWLYEIRQERVNGIGFTRSFLHPLPSGATKDLRDGSSERLAVILEKVGSNRRREESTYIRTRLMCDFGAKWKIIGTTVIAVSNQHFDRVLLDCPNSKYRSNIYFQI